MIKMAVLWGIFVSAQKHNSEVTFWYFVLTSEKGSTIECRFECRFECLSVRSEGSSSRIHSTFSSSHGDWPPYGHSLWQRATKGASSLVPRSGAPLDSPYWQLLILNDLQQPGWMTSFSIIETLFLLRMTSNHPKWGPQAPDGFTTHMSL